MIWTNIKFLLMILMKQHIVAQIHRQRCEGHWQCAHKKYDFMVCHPFLLCLCYTSWNKYDDEDMLIWINTTWRDVLISANLAGALRDWLLNNIVHKTSYKGTNVNTVYQVLYSLQLALFLCWTISIQWKHIVMGLMYCNLNKIF